MTLAPGHRREAGNAKPRAPEAAADLRSEADASFDALVLTFGLHGRLAATVARQGRPYGLHATQALTLIVLGRAAMPVSSLARVVGMRPNGASMLVSRLAALGLVRCQRSLRDHRVVTVGLTDTGQHVADIITARVAEAARPAFNGLDAAEREQLAALLAALTYDTPPPA